eukprot:5867744-Pyramimonas_sp.AAC.1
MVTSEALSQEREAQQLLTWAPRHSIPPKVLLQATRLGMKTECHSLAISAKAAMIRAASHSDMFHKLMFRTLEEHEAKFGAVDISHGKTTQKNVALDLKTYM